MKFTQLLRNKTLFFNCDVQTVFSNPANMYNPQQVIRCASFMNEVADILEIPVIISEQNPKAFGLTVPEVKASLGKLHHFYEKHTFTMINEDGIKYLNLYPERNQAVIYGIEAHVCVQQTCLDLIQKGYQVHIITDGTSSNRPLFRSTAYQRLQQAGVILDSSQSIVFELLKSYKDDKFKPILGLIKKYKLDDIFANL